jgi:hypothetical protein
MSIHVANCPRCDAKKTTFDVLTVTFVRNMGGYPEVSYLEAPIKCRNCKRVSILGCSTDNNRLAQNIEKAFNDHSLLSDCVRTNNFVSLADVEATPPPQHLPDKIYNAFVEGSKCYAAGCYNGAGAMFRLSLDLASKSLLPQDDVRINHRQKNYLADRLEWLFDNNHWPSSLKEMVTCIRQDGNDGAHDGELGEMEAFDIMDFTSMVLEKIYTEPERIRISKERRQGRKQPNG